MYTMSDADSECWSDVDNFPPLQSLVKNSLNMKSDRNVESSHPGNGRSHAKIKLNLIKTKNKNKPSPRVSTRGALKKEADDFMNGLGGNLVKLNEILNVFSKSMFQMLKNCAKTESHTTSIAHKITELGQKIISMDKRMTDRMTV